MTFRTESIVSFALVSALLSSLSARATAQEPGTQVPVAASPGPGAGDAGEPIESVVPTATAPSGNKLGVSDNVGALDREVTEKSWPNVPLLATGLVVLGGTYGASVIVGAVSDRDADKKLYYPVVGPWLDLNDRGCGERACSNETLNKALLIGGGVLQGAGALGVLLSLVIPQTTTRNWYLIGSERVIVAPQVGASSLGVGASGRF